MKTTTIIARTSKGARVFLEGVGRTGAQYNVTITPEAITVSFTSEGKRKVVTSKGGVIDLESKKVAAWAQDANSACIVDNGDTITITRG